MKSLLITIIKKFSFVFAFSIILIALLIILTRSLTPLLNHHRVDFAKLASNLLHAPVTIGQVEASWYQYQPEISLNETTVFSADTQKPILKVQKIRIFFSIPMSIWQWKLIPSGVMLSGADVNISQDAQGKLKLKGLNQPFEEETGFSNVAAFLSMQPRLILEDINVHYTNKKNLQKFFTIYKLNLQNIDDKHIVFGKAILHQDIPTEVQFALQLHGEILELSQIKAKIYLYVSGLSIPQWFKEYNWQNWQISRGIGSAKIWASWSHGEFRKIQSAFQIYGLNLYSLTNKSTHPIERISGNISWLKKGNEEVLAGNDILIDLPTHLWPMTNFYLAFNQNIKGDLTPRIINIGYFDLHDAQPFLEGSKSFLPNDWQKQLLTLQLKGNLQNTNANFTGAIDDWHHANFKTNFNHIGFLPSQNIPGVENFSGNFSWDGSSGNLILQSQRAKLRYDPFYLKPIFIDHVNGEIQAALDVNNNWSFKTKLIQIFNNDLTADLSGAFNLATKGSPFVDMSVNFSLKNIHHLSLYLPLKTFDAELLKWLQQAFISGEIASANVNLKGSLDDFPFDNKNGNFLFSSTLKNVKLLYSPDWPMLKNINGKLIFHGHQMTLNADKARILNTPLGNIHAVIPYIGHDKDQELQLTSDEIHTDFDQITRFIKQSPLNKTFGKMFSALIFQGPLKLNLGLIIPLSTSDSTKVKGVIAFDNNDLKVVTANLHINQLNGLLHFTEDSMNAESLQGKMFNKPININITTQKNKAAKATIIAADIKTHLDISDIENILAMPLKKFASGSTDVYSKIQFAENKLIALNVYSDLKGLAINLPDQYGKKSDESRKFIANLALSEKEELKLQLSYGNLLNGALILDKENNKYKLNGADLRFGAGDAAWPKTSGIYVTGNVQQLNWDKIKNYLQQTGGGNAVSQLRGIDIFTKSLIIANQQFSDMRLNITPKENYWFLNISSPDIDGEIQIPKEVKPQKSVIAQFQRLNLQPVTSSSISAFDMKSLPEINFSASNVSYKDTPLGQIIFSTSPTKDGLRIQTFRIISSKMNLQATGNWTQKNKLSTTHLQGDLNSENVSDLLSSFNVDVHNFISSYGKLNFNLNWQDAPYIFSLADLNGLVTLELGKGRIVDVGENSAKMDLGKMLSIFSFQSIPRRLSLDFSDLFQKGYSFDSIKGNFVIRHGNAYTNNSHIEGSIASVKINGRIGFKDKDYDLTISITPSVSSMTSGLPVAATLLTAGNPFVFVGAVAANVVTGSLLSKAATYNYVVKGNWNNPRWEPAGVQKK